jgi:tetratricopeptide (TPR) repeat protein
MTDGTESSIPKKVAVIDSDAAMANLTEKHVKAMGSRRVDVYHDPDIGYKAIRSGDYDSAIIDWKLKGQLSSLAMLSRLRRHPDFVYFPIIISTGMIKREDLRIIKDFQCTKVMEKPLRQRTITQDFSELTAESEWLKTKEQDVKSALSQAAADPAQARAEVERILTTNPQSNPLAMIVANQLTKLNLLEQAAEIYDNTLKTDPNYLPALNGKAKIYSKMGRYKEAMETLKAAQKLSPQNIERLSLMGEIEISLRNPEAAIENFQNALKVDSKDTKAQVGIAVAKSMQISATQANNNPTNSPTNNDEEEQSVAKVMNNIAVNLAKQGQYEKAVKYYLMSFAFVGSRDLQIRVSYNMGLGFKKWDKLPQAKFWLQKSLHLSDGKFTKAANQLIGLEGITPLAGLGGPSKKSKPKFAASTRQAVPAIDPPTKLVNPSPASPDPTPAPAKATAAPEDEDLSFLEEETVSNHKTKPGASGATTGGASKAFEAMVSEIDTIVELDDNFTFDDKFDA